MPSKPDRQHYITASYIEQWAENGEVAVVCMYHRETVQVSFKALHYARKMASHEQESAWSQLEYAAKIVIDELHTALGTSTENLSVAEAHLMVEPSRIETLIDFAALYHARSLIVPQLQFVNNDGESDVAATSDQIEVRWRDAHRRYHGCGIEIAVHANDSIPLGAVPVLDSDSWGDRPAGVAEFIMPLSPHVLISGASDHPELAPGAVQVVEGSSSQEKLIQWQSAGARRLLSSPHLICQPSSSAAISKKALRYTEGGDWHRLALDRRCQLANNATWGDRIRWHDRQLRQKSDLARYALPETTESEKSEIWQRNAERARLTQGELDAQGLQTCACKLYRQEPVTSAAWAQIMPQVICDAVQRKRNESRRATE